MELHHGAELIEGVKAGDLLAGDGPARVAGELGLFTLLLVLGLITEHDVKLVSVLAELKDLTLGPLAGTVSVEHGLVFTEAVGDLLLDLARGVDGAVVNESNSLVLAVEDLINDNVRELALVHVLGNLSKDGSLASGSLDVELNADALDTINITVLLVLNVVAATLLAARVLCTVGPDVVSETRGHLGLVANLLKSGVEDRVRAHLCGHELLHDVVSAHADQTEHTNPDHAGGGSLGALLEANGGRGRCTLGCLLHGRSLGLLGVQTPGLLLTERSGAAHGEAAIATGDDGARGGGHAERRGGAGEREEGRGGHRRRGGAGGGAGGAERAIRI